MKLAIVVFSALVFSIPPAQQPGAAQQLERPVMSSPSRIIAPGTDHKLPNGRKLVYEVEWRLWTAGTATLRIDSTGGVQRVTATADSTGALSLLYPVRDSFEAYFDPRTFCSSRISKNVHEGMRKRETQIRYDTAQRKAVLQEKNLNSGATKQLERETPGCVTDVLSAFFYVASLPLSEGVTYDFPLNDGGETVNVRVHVEGTEEITTPAGTYNAIRVRPEATSGALNTKGKLWIWYTDDAERIPVQVRARMLWGSVTLRLQRMEPTASGSVR